jgi:ferredoxin-NADP reductase
VAEVGAPPKVPGPRRRALKAVRSLFSPLLPDDYLELINPLWSTRELRGRIERIENETDNAVTIVIKPGFEWEGHEPGQFLRVGVVVDGVHHWRAYSLTSDPSRSDGCICITPKLVEEGKVTPYFVRHAKPGALVRLGGVEGGFVLPDPLPERLLFISAGSGVTPIMSMLRALDHRDEVKDVLHVHSARTEDDVIFGSRLRELDSRQNGYTLKLRLTGEEGRLKPADLDEVCPDWRDRETYLSGPEEMIDAMLEHWEANANPRLTRASLARAARSSSSAARPRRSRTARSRSSSRARTPGSNCRSAAARGFATRASASSAPGRCAICVMARCTAPRGR